MVFRLIFARPHINRAGCITLPFSGAKGATPLSGIGFLHDKLVLNRRVDILSGYFAQLIPKDTRVLDVGCGDGLISSILQSKRPDISIQGIDVLPREQAHIPVKIFDGAHIPFEEGSFDVVLFSDVLHSTGDPVVLQRGSAESCKSVCPHQGPLP